MKQLDPALREVLYSTVANPAPANTWYGPNGETVTYHWLGDFWEWRLPDGSAGRSDMQEIVLTALGLLGDVETVIRKALAGHVHNDRAEIEATRSVLAALEAAGLVIIEATALDGV